MNISTILVPIDFSDVSTKVVRMADELARAFGSRIVLLYVTEPEPEFVGFEPGPQSVRMAVARDFAAEHQRLEEFKSLISGEGKDVLALHIQGPLVEKVLSQAKEQDASMIVMGSHGHGALYSLLVGSVTSGVLKSATCPVVVVPADKSTAAQ